MGKVHCNETCGRLFQCRGVNAFLSRKLDFCVILVQSEASLTLFLMLYVEKKKGHYRPNEKVDTLMRKLGTGTVARKEKQEGGAGPVPRSTVLLLLFSCTQPEHCLRAFSPVPKEGGAFRRWS